MLFTEEHHWYFDNLKDGIFRAEYSTADAVVESGAMDSKDQVLTIKGNQDSVKIPFLEMSCIFRGEQCQNGVTLAYWINLKTQKGNVNALIGYAPKLLLLLFLLLILFLLS